MYTPEAFREEDRNEISAMIRSCGLANLVTYTPHGLLATPVPMLFAEDEGEHGALYGHISKANPQWKDGAREEALVIFQGANAYISPSWYPTKAETGRVVPTWNYIAVHAYGPVEFFQNPQGIFEIVSRLTRLYEEGRPKSWSVNDAPAEYIEGQVRAIVGFRIPIRRIEAKKKLSQNQPAANRVGAKEGLMESPFEGDRQVAERMAD